MPLLTLTLALLGHLNLAPGALVASPRKVTSFHSPHVLQIECTAAATAILHAPTPQDRAVVVFSSNDAARVLFPVALSFPRTISQYTSSTQVRQQQRHNNSRLHRIVRLAAGNGQFAALTSAGEVFLWTPPGEQADPWLHATFPQSRPKRIWAVRNRAWLAARDVAVGIDSSILVATRSGHVYQGKRREKAKSRLPTAKKGEGETDMVFFKFGMVPSLQHTTRVAASTSGAFMALRVDERPGGGIIEGMGRLRREIGDLVGDEEADGDVLFAVEDGEAKAHRCVLAARSTFLRHLFEEAEDLNIGEKRDFEEGISVERLRDAEDWDGEGPSFKLTIAGCHHQSLLPLLQFTYSASFTKTWDHTAFSPEPGKKKGGKPQGPTPATIYADFRRLVKLFGLGDADAIQFSQEQDRISRDFGHALMSLVDLAAEPSRPSVFPDTVLRLSDRDVEVHQIVLVARCPFFAAMLGGGAGRWGLQRDDRGRISVGLTHLRWEVVRIVLAWMYADLDARALFADVAKPSVADLDEFVVEVLAAATELMLPQLKDLCCSILANTMDLRNVNSLLQTADMFDAEGLKDACLDFLCWNLELCIGTGMLNELGDELIEEISGRLRQLQTTKYPFIRGEDGYYAQVRREATRLEEERKARRRIDFVERRKLEELSRSLDDATISMLIANGAFDGPGPEASSRGDAASSESGDDVGHIDAGRLARSGSDRAMDRGGDDDIFDLEIDDGASSMGASSAKGKPPTATASSSSFSANWTRPLPAQAATVLATSPKTASASAMQSPRSEPPTTPSSKRVSKASWKRVDLATGKVVQDQPEPQPAPIAAAESKSPAAPKTWSVPLSTEKAKKTSLLDIMSETTTSTKVPSGAAPAKGQKSGISSTSSTPISGSVQAKTPPSAAAPSTPRMIKSHTWASSPSVPAANSPMASPPPTAMLTQQAHAGQGLASPVSLSLASTAAFVPSSGSQKDRRRNAKLQKVEPTLGIGQSGPKCWKGWAPVETPPPQPLMVQPPPPPSPAQLAARLREFPAIGNATSAPKDVRRERVW